MKLKLLLFAVSICLLNCKEETSQKQMTFDHKYQTTPDMLQCDGIDTAIFQEAMLSFENDILKYYTPDQPIITRAYSIFVAQGVSNKAEYKKMVSEHSKKVFEALKQVDNLWIESADGNHINYQHPIFKCIGENINDEPLRKTYNALIETNSMSIRIFQGQLRRKTFGMKDDRHLATFVALQLFYGKLFDVNFDSDPQTSEEPNNNTQNHDAHDGHNH